MGPAGALIQGWRGAMRPVPAADGVLKTTAEMIPALRVEGRPAPARHATLLDHKNKKKFRATGLTTGLHKTVVNLDLLHT